MEIILAVLSPVVECASPHVAKRWEYHRDIKKSMGSLREALEKLIHRKADLTKKLETMVIPGESEVVEEVMFWLERVEKINIKIDEIEKEVARVKFFSRAGLGRKVAEMKPDVDALHEEGGSFEEGRLVRKLALRGSEKPTVTILEGETTREMTRGKILGCLVDKEVTRIGVYGMGGLGKTTMLEHVHNGLLEPGDNIGSMFNKVIWSTASKGSGVRGLQDKIAHELGMEIKRDDDEEIRAKDLLREFSMANNKRFVLIIDDMWEDYCLEKIGVPNPTRENGCKLILTSRSRDVCRKMKCDRIIEMELLSEEESMELFLDGVGITVVEDPNLHKMAKQVARECSGLPLAIVTVAGSLRDKTDLIEWEVALTELKDATSSISSDITTILRFSYDRLIDENLKKCLLYCALYPEDYLIEKRLLMDQLIAEGTVPEGRTRQYQMGKCHVMLNQLVSNCLLIDAVNNKEEKCVKLHDSVRDMAIQIMRESPSRFVVEVGNNLESLKPEEKWGELVEKVSLMENKIKEIPFSQPLECPRLSTLFLGKNYKLRVYEELFMGMQGLCVLDLSDTRFRSLPRSVSNLTNLEVLLLRECLYLIDLPDLSKLRKLTRLDLFNTSITEFPKGVEKLPKMTYLDLGWTKITSFPRLCELSNLWFLSIDFSGSKEPEKGKELATLKNIESLKVVFKATDQYNAYVRSITDGDSKLVNFAIYVKGLVFKDDLANSVSMYFTGEDKRNGLDLPVMLPKNVKNLKVSDCPTRSLCSLTPVENLTDLQRLVFYDAPIDCLFYYSPTVFPLLQKIEELHIYKTNMCGLVCLEGDGVIAPPLPLGAFSSLKKLWILDCKSIKTLFSFAKDASFPDLEEMRIRKCYQLEEIMVYENQEGILSLPRLKNLELDRLPRLKSVPFVAYSLSTVKIIRCPKLKEVACLERQPRPSLQNYEIDADPWKSLAEGL